MKSDSGRWGDVDSTCSHRRAGACPPRSLDRADDSRHPSVVRERPLPNGSRAGAFDLQRRGGLVHERWRGTGPRPTVTRAFFVRDREDAFFPRRAWACPPRSLGYADDSPPSVVREHLLPNGSRAGALALQRRGGLVPERWRGTGPRPTVRGGVFCSATRGCVFFHRSAGACPPRSLGYADDSRHPFVVRECPLPNGSRAGALALQRRGGSGA